MNPYLKCKVTNLSIVLPNTESVEVNLISRKTA